MTAIIITVIFLALILGLNCIPLLIKTDFPKAKKVIVRMLVVSTIFFLTFSILEFYGYRLKGFYSFPVIGLTFIALTLIYFGLCKNTHKKVLTVFLLTPLLILCIFTLIFGQTLKEFDINDNTKIMVRTSGLLSCGELIYITKTKFGLFDKEVHYESSLCLRGIKQIKTVKIDDRKIEFLIYHNAEQDSENPYKYDVERQNGW
jgi:ABC-2 type transport system permease protein